MNTASYAYEHVTSSVLSEDMTFRDGAPRPGERLQVLTLSRRSAAFRQWHCEFPTDTFELREVPSGHSHCAAKVALFC